MRVIDLHTHSDRSDGTCSPEQVVREASARGTELLALADHDTMSGWNEARAAARRLGVPLCPAVEISTCFHDSLHILGYGVDPGNKQLALRLNDYRERRMTRVRKMVGLLKEAGLDISFDELRQREGSSLGRPHVADLLRKKGLAATRQEAFSRFLVPGKPGYVGPCGPCVEEAISAVRESGGLAVLAHPGVVMGVIDLPAWTAVGLGGLEVFYPVHSVSLMRRLMEAADKYGLVATGGTDYHGPGSDREARAGIEVPDEIFEKMKKIPGFAGMDHA
ncbi:MAG: PHP domain-containing protein [bacterium]